MIGQGYRGMLSGFGSINAATVTTTGAIVAGTTVTAGTGLTVTTGDATVTAGALNAANGVTGQSRLFAANPIDSGALLVTSGRCYAVYIGQAPRDLTAIDAHVYMSGAVAVAGAGGASVNWAEVGIATGTLESISAGAETTLTILAATSINAEALTASTTLYAKTLTATIARDAGMWVVVAGAYEVTQMTVRSCPGADMEGASRYRVATQPSLNIGTPLAFTGTPGSGIVIPFLRARVA